MADSRREKIPGNIVYLMCKGNRKAIRAYRGLGTDRPHSGFTVIKPERPAILLTSEHKSGLCYVIIADDVRWIESIVIKGC